MLSQIGIKGKLLLLCTALSLIMAAVGVSGFLSLRRLSDTYHHVSGNNLPHVKIAGEMFRRFRQIRIDMMAIALTGANSGETKGSLEDMKKYIEEYETASAQYAKAEYSPGVAFGPGEKELFEGVSSEWETFKKSAEKIIALAQSGSAQDFQNIAAICLNQGEKDAKAFNTRMNKLIDYNDAEAGKWVAEAEAVAVRANWISLVIIALGALFSMGFGYVFSARMSRSLRQVTQDLSRGANTVANAAHQISNAGSALSSSTTEQAAALQETVASLEEVSAMVAKNAENAKRSQQAAKDSQKSAQQGSQIVGEMIRSIQDISDSNGQIMNQVEASNQDISQIVKIISEISEKTKVINDIVFQTKLLSFNASVEAARAGEHGKGFAVVAEEVGNLAQMSGNASKEISQLLESSIQKVESTVNQSKSKVEALIRTGKEKVDTGCATAKRCGEVLEDIVSNVTSVGEMVAEISVACNEQAQGVSEINKAMNQMDNVTQQNAGASQQTATSSDELTQQAQSLRHMVGSLFQLIDGRPDGAAAKTDGDRHESHARQESSNVVEFHSRSQKAPVREQALKDVVGSRARKKVAGELNIPSGDDPRFEDV